MSPARRAYEHAIHAFERDNVDPVAVAYMLDCLKYTLDLVDPLPSADVHAYADEVQDHQEHQHRD